MYSDRLGNGFTSVQEVCSRIASSPVLANSSSANYTPIFNNRGVRRPAESDHSLDPSSKKPHLDL